MTGTPTEDSEAVFSAFGEWQRKAEENVNEWGIQDRQTLLLAMQEELGELTQAVLEAEHEGGSVSRELDELDDLGALLVQFALRVRQGDAE